MGLAIGSVALLGADASFWSLMPSFAVIGIGGGLTIPLTATVLGVMPTGQAGVASGVFNASREVAGLLGITVIGAVLTSRQSTALADGHTPVDAFLSGYQAGLLLAAVLVVAGGVAAFAVAAPGARRGRGHRPRGARARRLTGTGQQTRARPVGGRALVPVVAGEVRLARGTSVRPGHAPPSYGVIVGQARAAPRPIGRVFARALPG